MAGKRSCTLAEARAAKARARAVFAQLGTVVGIGVTRVEDGYGIKVNLESPPVEGLLLPSWVGDVPVRVEVVGIVRKQ